MTYRLWKVHQTLMEMCHDRKYIVPYTEISKQDFETKFSKNVRPSHLEDTFEREGDPTDRIALFLPDDEKVGIGTIREYDIRIDELHCKSAIIVVQSKLTPSAQKSIRECNAKGKFVQVFHITELVVNITHHELVPRHVVQTDSEKKALLQRYKLKENQLPRIKVSDPVAKYFGLRRGQVCKIVRENSPTAGRYISYRIVY